MVKKEKITKKVYVYEVIETKEPDLYVGYDGGIKFEGKLLKYLSLDNQPGKILAMFTMDGIERFVSDKQIQKVVGADSSYLDWGYVIRDLKNYLKKEGIVADIQRRKEKKGYALVSMEWKNDPKKT